jgi:hypothetical protein
VRRGLIVVASLLAAGVQAAEVTETNGLFTLRGSTGFITAFTAQTGHFTVTGLGRDWITGTNNTVVIHPAQVTGLKAVSATRPGQLYRVRVNREACGSVAMVRHGFPVESIGYPYDPRQWRTIGVDYSRKSGADAVLVFVEGEAGFGDRRRAWEADLGNLSTNDVVIEGLTFTVKPPGTTATMRGTVLYPTTALIEYRDGRLRIWRTKPEKAADVNLVASLDQKVEEIGLAFSRKIDEDVENELKLVLNVPLEEGEHPDVKAKREKQHLNYFAKMFKHSTSTSMGGPNRRPQARESWVIVLTIQEGAAPIVTPVPFEDEALVKVGPQPVQHQEYLIEFGEAR